MGTQVTNAHVLSVITGPDCKVLGQVKISVPIDEAFRNSREKNNWLVAVSQRYPKANMWIHSTPCWRMSIAGVADRIAEHLQQTA